jgi:hypothetical protein
VARASRPWRPRPRWPRHNENKILVILRINGLLPTRRFLLLVMPIIFSSVFLIAARAVGEEDNPPARIARISFLSGKVSLEPAGVDQWSEASLYYPAESIPSTGFVNHQHQLRIMDSFTHNLQRFVPV